MLTLAWQITTVELVIENRVRIINPFENLQPTDARSIGSSG